MIAPARVHTDAVEHALSLAGLKVGRGQPPAGAGWQGQPGASTFAGYAVLFPYAGRTAPSAISLPRGYLEFGVQITCVGATQPQAEMIMDSVKAALVGVRLSVEGRSSFPADVVLVRPAARDDQLAPPLHYTVAQFEFRTEPA